MEEKKLLDMFELGNEISSLVVKGEIPPSIGERIKEKIKERGISLTKDQLYKLVNRVKGILKSHPTKGEQKIASEANLLDTISNLQSRVEYLERVQNQWMKGISKLKEVEASARHVKESALSSSLLSDIPNDPKSVVIAMKWLQFLINKVGAKRVPEVLNYYVDIGWLDERVKLRLLEYCEGLAEEGSSDAREGGLTARDHIQSFLFIQKLLGREINNLLVEQIDRDISKIMKNLESLGI